MSTSTKSNPDIDFVWNSLKNEDALQLMNDGISASVTKRPAEQRHGRPSNLTPSKKRGQFSIKFIGRPFDIDAPITDSRGADPMHGSTKIEEAYDCSYIMCGLCMNGASVGDSDDEEEHAEENVPLCKGSGNSWRIEREAKILDSDDASTRVKSLAKLKLAIDSLSLHCPLIPPINYPRPYDDSHVRLNQKLSVVSDFVEPEFLRNKKPSTQMAKSLDHPCTTDRHCLNEEKGRVQALFTICGNPLFRLVGDKSEKCRILAVECLQSLILTGIDLGRHIPYMIPALCARFPTCAYDKDMEVFVQDHQLHAFFKRGGATDRQDRDSLFSRGRAFKLIEPSEEIRLELCRTFNCIIRGMSAMGAVAALDAYFSEIVFSLQTSLRDPFPELKVEACQLLVQLLRIPQWEQGAKYFATGLARSALPNCHRGNVGVILAAMDLFEASVCVPDRAKVKGAGSAAISDLVGFREENVLPIAAFYGSQFGVSVNTLAELASHKNHRVRLRCCKMLSYFLVYLPDRYDHQQRLLPYILSFMSDDQPDVQNAALKCIEKCGLQYECEKPDDVIERRQFGVDGKEDIDYESELPAPFTGRPSLGARLFVRANAGRFFFAILNELSNWREETRKRSAALLLILTVYCEEHLTKDFQHTVSSMGKAIDVELISNDKNNHLKILDNIRGVLRLMARYIDPATYLPLICPRITGDASSATSNAEDGSHSDRKRSTQIIILSSLIDGTPLKTLIRHWLGMVSMLSSAECIGPFVGTQTRTHSLNTLSRLIFRVKDADHFVNHLAGMNGESLIEHQAVLASCMVSLRELLECSDIGKGTMLAAECIDGLSAMKTTSVTVN